MNWIRADEMVKSQDAKFMAMAVEKALEGVKDGQTPFGACIVRDGELLSCEHNIVWSSTDITAHAEVNAIRCACRNTGSIDLSGSTIYSTCEPCPMCFSASHWAGIKRIVFGATIEDAKDFGFSELYISNQQMKELGRSSMEVVPDFMRDECVNIFRVWSQRPDRKIY